MLAASAVTTYVHNERGEVEIIGVSRDITERKRAEQQIAEAHAKLAAQVELLHEPQAELREQSIRDPLTHLFNRRYINETLPREIARAFRLQQTIGILMLDLDHFKHINDTHGHLAGDFVLQTIAKVVQSKLRASDIVCRYGGEEILCVMGIALNQANAALYRAKQDGRNCVRCALQLSHTLSSSS